MNLGKGRNMIYNYWWRWQRSTYNLSNQDFPTKFSSSSYNLSLFKKFSYAEKKNVIILLSLLIKFDLNGLKKARDIDNKKPMKFDSLELNSFNTDFIEWFRGLLRT